ncbi:MAG: hypothetical protein EPN37_10310 [Chitinophagaceae bacterium]|nr:MAG: hypothetical protein EPN37_10310 [Chitinophagaceae bacterium]
MSRSELLALFNLTRGYVCNYDPVGYGNMITKELMTEIVDQMDRMLNNMDQKRYTLRLSGSQSMSFIAFWIHIDTTRHPYEMIIINRIVESIHKTNLYARIQAPL